MKNGLSVSESNCTKHYTTIIPAGEMKLEFLENTNSIYRLLELAEFGDIIVFQGRIEFQENPCYSIP